MKFTLLAMALAALTLAPVVLAAEAAAPTLESLAAQIKVQQAQIEALAAAAEKPLTGSAFNNTTLGMYGEVHYNQLRSNDPAVAGSNFHTHRVVFLVGHEFSQDVRFYSEVEFEGAPDSSEIETEVEQFFVNWKLNEKVSLDIGQFLIPVGILNETHEPDVFYGVERNPVEELIIPATWWEKGVMARTTPLPGLAVDVAIHNGLRGCILDIAATPCEEKGLGSAEGLREFRQEFGGSRADDLAYTLRVKYTGFAGLELGVAAQRQDNITQGQDIVGGKAPAMLYEAHADWHWQGLGLRGLYARWDIDNEMASNNGSDKLEGFYIEPSWKVTEKFGLFARYNSWNTAANVPGQKDSHQSNAGVNYWIAPHVVLKADVQNTNQPEREGDGFNLGLGLSF